MPCLDHPAQGAHDIGFGAVIHGQVRVIPVSQYSKPLEIGVLPGNLFPGVFAAGIAKRTRINPDAGLAYFLLHLVLNRKSMAIPAGHVRAIQPVEAV